jgi:hypothetical protein
MPDNNAIGEGTAMPAFVIACLAAAAIAVGAVAVLNKVQKPVESAFATTGVRI